jgi:hypothetical protein
MNGKQTWVIGVAIVLGCLILGLFFGQPSAAQKVPKAPGPVTVQGKGGQRVPGRYQVAIGGDSRLLKTVVIDTATGQCWYVVGQGRWEDQGSPPLLKVKK